MKIVTEEFTKTIESLIKGLQPKDFSSNREYEISNKYHAFPFGSDLFCDVYLTPKGEIILDDYSNSDEGEIVKSKDLQMLINLLVAEKENYPELEKLIPNRSDDSKDCPVCKTNGMIKDADGKDMRCFICAGIGWITKEAYTSLLENSE